MVMLKEFKEFAVKGNMIDMAVGIIIGGAFGTIVKSLVDDVIMPLVSGIFDIPDFSNLFIILKGTGEDFTSVELAREAGASVLAYGQFINAVIAFLIVAWAVFFLVKGVNHLKRKQEPETKADEPKGPTEVELLAEIRDSLKNK
ncbi:large conductance mechanosensitive channel protein MscL [Candidatus Campbellbacteria bacterium]|nr:large conductance mechanosensitive channel protein MscL [Candidatus Campbellbacteria bacterium]